MFSGFIEYIPNKTNLNSKTDNTDDLDLIEIINKHVLIYTTKNEIRNSPTAKNSKEG